MVKSQHVNQTPLTDDFRRWLKSALATLNIPAATVSSAVMGSKNNVSAFLGDPGRDIMLGNAGALERHLRGVAHDRGLSLPKIGNSSPSAAGGADA